LELSLVSILGLSWQTPPGGQAPSQAKRGSPPDLSACRGVKTSSARSTY
jgi:hypothetical protein